MTRDRRPGPSTRVRVDEYVEGRVRHREDRLATEEPLEIRLASPAAPARRVAVTMRTPGHDFELAAGFLHAEGVLGSAEDVHTVAYCTDNTLTPEQEFNVVTVQLARAPVREPAVRYDGPTAGASACGVCGAESIDDVLALGEVARASDWQQLKVSPDVVRDLPERMRTSQRVFDATGGLHAAGLFTPGGELLVAREDIGRHNAVDKVVGARLLGGEPAGAAVLCVSGRVGFEIAQKAVAAGIGMLVAVGAPSSLAVALAERAGLCTVGFAGPDRFVTYTVPDRIGV